MTPPVLPLMPDWADGLREERAFRTEVLVAEDGTEQRAQKRGRTRRTLSYRALTLDPAVHRRLGTLLQRIHEDVIALPWWMDATPLTAAVVATDTALTCDTTGRAFLAGNYVVLWRSPLSYELAIIDSVGLGTVTLTAGLAGDWAAGTWVLPAFPARLRNALATTRPTPRGYDLSVEADVDPLSCPEATGAAGDTPPDFPLAIEGLFGDPETWHRNIMRLDGETGDVTQTVLDTQPTVEFQQRVGLKGRTAIATLLTWYDAVLGALTPSWVPNQHATFALAAPVAAVDTALVIQAMDYTSRWFPNEARRHLALVTGATTWVHRRVTASVDNLDGTETLTLDGAAGVALPESGLVSLLYFARLAQDPLALTWFATDLAEAVLTFREIPAEAPATV